MCIVFIICRNLCESFVNLFVTEKIVCNFALLTPIVMYGTKQKKKSNFVSLTCLDTVKDFTTPVHSVL